ncbi:MAG: DUF2461 domain-containing protein [Rikenellaceae bacterium]|nr:DUF2461 domain-containing protein [Rikenellaceae bacterium]
MKTVIDFLSRLRENNDREWFNRNKEEYREALAAYNAFAAELIDEISKFDPDAVPLGIRDCTYRIYRDVRFSPNKEPYKSALGVYICRGGKKTGFAGYYIHFEPEGEASQGSFMTSGVYMPEPFVLKSIREEILDNGDDILKAIESANGFTVCRERQLKKNPAGFPPGSPFDELLKLKDFYIIKPLDMKYITGGELAKRAAADFRKTYPLIRILNRAVEYAYEENGML